jgi:hypothetical protein
MLTRSSSFLGVRVRLALRRRREKGEDEMGSCERT